MEMEIRFGHDVENNYVLIGHSNLCLQDYKLNMLLKNHIKGLLKLCVGCVDGHAELTYTISAKQSLHELYEKKKMNFGEVFQVLDSLVEVCHTVQRYLLKPEDILLETALVFLDYHTGEWEFCYYPESGNKTEETVRNFVQDLLTITDHTDQQAVEFIYGVSEICNGKNFLIREIEEWMERYDIKETSGKEETKKSLYSLEKYEEYQGEKSSVSEEKGIYMTQSLDMKKGWRNTAVVKKMRNILGGRNVGRQSTEQQEPKKNILEEPIMEKPIMEEPITKVPIAKEQSCKDTLYIKDILYNTQRKLLSLTEKDNIDIVKYPFVIGKLRSRVDYVLEDKLVSRIHLRISKDEEAQYYMEDMNSKNGTFLNGIRTEPYEKVKIEIGDRIGIAVYEYIFR